MKIRIILLVSLVALLVFWWLNRPKNDFRMIFCDVGQGDAALVVLGNFQMMIDTGPENRKVLNCLESNMPFADKQLEVVVITHWDLDHAGGIRDILKYYRIEKVFSGVEPSRYFEQINYTGNLKQNDVLRYGELVFEILSTEGIEGKGIDGDNGNSVVGVLNYGDYQFFMMGDVSKEVEQRLVWRGLVGAGQRAIKGDKGRPPTRGGQARSPVQKIVGAATKGGHKGRPYNTILKISHHGSETGTSDELLDEIKPETAIISVGKGNSFGHPTATVLDKLNKRGIKILRTDLMGDIKVHVIE